MTKRQKKHVFSSEFKNKINLLKWK